MINLVGMLTADLILAQVTARPDFGEEHMVDDFVIRPGALANIIYPLTKLGIKPRVISSLGHDQFGEEIYNGIRTNIVDQIVRTETPTAVSVSVVKDDGARFFVTYSGNAYEFTEEIVHRCGKQFDQAKAMMFYGYFLMPKFGARATIRCLERAKVNGQVTFFDANSAIDGWSERSRNETYSFLPHIDYFMPNDEELLQMTGMSTIEDAVQLLKAHGANTIVVKRGKDGATAFTEDGVFHHNGFEVKAYDTTGAGDSFNAGFMYSLMQDGNLERALTFGNSLASIVVSKKSDRYPTLDEVQRKIASHQAG